MTPTLAAARPGPSRWAQFYALTKPRVVQLIVFCAVIGMLLAQPGWPDWRLAGSATLGIWLVASAAAVFNCLVEQRIDSRMARTAWRATAKGQLSRDRPVDRSRPRPEGRWGLPEDVAAAVSALASGSFAFSQGQVVTVDGGLTLPRF